MNAYELAFSAIDCFKVVVRSVKIGKAIVFLVDPYYEITATVPIIITYNHVRNLNPVKTQSCKNKL